MKSKARIRVIRKKDLAKKDAEPVRAEEAPRTSARNMVANVSTWVTDLQRRKRAETREALDKLFPANPQADSA